MIHRQNKSTSTNIGGKNREEEKSENRNANCGERRKQEVLPRRNRRGRKRRGKAHRERRALFAQKTDAVCVMDGNAAGELGFADLPFRALSGIFPYGTGRGLLFRAGGFRPGKGWRKKFLSAPRERCGIVRTRNRKRALGKVTSARCGTEKARCPSL